MRPVLIALLSIASLARGAGSATGSTNTKPPAKPRRTGDTETRPLPTLSMIVPERDRNAVYAYYRDEVAAGRLSAQAW